MGSLLAACSCCSLVLALLSEIDLMTTARIRLIDARLSVKRNSGMKHTRCSIDVRMRMLFERGAGVGKQGSFDGSSEVILEFRPDDCKEDVEKPTSPHPPHGVKKNGYKKNGTRQLRLRIMGCFCFG